MSEAEKKFIGVSETAIIARVRRALRKEGQSLRIDRSDFRGPNWLGLYVVDNLNNAIVAQNCSLHDLAKELGVLRPYELPQIDAA